VGRHSSVGVVTLYGLHGPELEKFYALVQTVPGSHPVSYTMGVGFGVKQPGRGVNHSSPSSAEVKGRVEL
jgi:hypothetical protein